ncbi:hypothetical protein DPMN_103742 [Dreissena polymorpha]|uniref:Neurotransmitter-gated ion-channel ligand-binding domain-containing protein n=1 Tax=Dreissena polymorpha TaxID=45954 RepID=A0A9D4H8F7_DREPO|nr:hypothetical protein DPMN_103742 [Dreissena polymorpha]
MCQPVFTCATLDETEKLYEHISKGYDKRLLPIVNQSEVIVVTVQVSVVSINKFDEISGDLGVTVLFHMTWRDERLT